MGLIQADIEKKIDDLLAQMTISEKAGQITQVGPSLVGGFDIGVFLDDPQPEKIQKIQWDYHEEWIREAGVGSYLGVLGAETINRLQKIALEETRLGIPLLFGLDVIHGYRTIFPIPLAEACSWEPELARRTAEVAAREAAAAGVHWTFAPMMDIARDARWGRVAEGTGEDPYLGRALAAAKVKGFQGDDFSQPDRLAACAKHYVAYGAAVAGRDYNTVEMALQTLHEVYLPPFAAAVKAGVATVMSAFNDLNGVPTSANHYTLTTVLREQLGFQGLVISDSNAIGELVAHRYAKDRKDAGKKAILAGIDMDMVTQSYRSYIPELVQEGIVSLKVVNEAVRRVLRIKFMLGLFENPYRTTPARENEVILQPEHIQLAREAARRAIVLLKNGVDNDASSRPLPLAKSIKKIAVIGPLANNAAEMLGSWAFTGHPQDAVSILAGIQASTGAGAEVVYARGCEANKAGPEDFTEAVAAAQQAEIVIAVVGETSIMSGEASSRMGLGLPGNQEQLLRAIHQTGKPLVVVLVNGRPLAIPWVAEHASAILEAWQLGIQAGHAVADVLFGDYNPSGKLAVTFPYAVGQVPIYYNHPPTGRPANDFKFSSKYIDGPVEPLYPFGYGLSYTQFKYTDLEISPANVSPGDTLTICARIANTGAVPGEEIAQLYVADMVASRVRPVKELKGFHKVRLEPGESKKIIFKLPVAELGFYGENMQYVVEPGTFKVWVGPNSNEGLVNDFEVV